MAVIKGKDTSETLTGGTGNDSITGAGGNDKINGGTGNDTLRGGTGNDAIVGAAGNDSMAGDDGNDTLSGDAGNDTLLGGAGNDSLSGGTENDSLDGGSGNDTLRGGAGDDILRSESGTNYLWGEDGNDQAFGGTGADALFGGNGNDYLRGNGGNDTINGEAGNDTLVGDAGNDVLAGGAGADTLDGGAGADTLDGGVVTDTTNYTDLNVLTFTGATQGVVVNLGTGIVSNDGFGTQDVVSNFIHVAGTQFDDSITGGTTYGYEQFEGGAGNDTIDGGTIGNTANRVSYASATEAVTVDLAAGTATGGAGNDMLININQVAGGQAGDTLFGSDATYTEQFIGRQGNDTIDGRGGFDIVRYDSKVSVDLATGIATSHFEVGTMDEGIDTLTGIEGVRGSRFDDTLVGGNAASDALETFLGMGGNDSIDGGSGIDRAEYTTATKGVVVHLGEGWALDGILDALGNEGEDELLNIENVRGGNFDDDITGDDNANRLEGQLGNDTLEGGAGDDTLVGGGGHDVYAFAANSGGGTDTLIGFEFGDILFLDGLSFDEWSDAGVEDLEIGKATLSGSTLFVRFTEGEEGLLAVNLGVELGRDNLAIQVDDDGVVLTYQVAGTDGDDNLNGNRNNNFIDGRGGNDFIFAGDGSDTVLGGDGDDYIGAGGNFQGGADTIDGGAGNDIVTYHYGAATTAINFTSTLATGFQVDALDGTIDTLVNIEQMHIFGGSAGDKLVGGAEGNYIAGNGGNDTLTGGGGLDSFAWTAGEGGGSDLITDLADGDDLRFEGMFITHVLAGNDASELMVGQVMVGTPSNGSTKLYARTSEGADGLVTITLTGNFDLNSFRITNDSWEGGSAGGLAVRLYTTGDDNLWNGNGAETINALAGDDWIEGNGGDDTLTGGGGFDSFAYNLDFDNGQDTITDLRGDDRIFFDRFELNGFVDVENEMELNVGDVQLVDLGQDTRLVIRTAWGDEGLLTIDLKGIYTTESFTIGNWRNEENEEEFHSELRVNPVEGEGDTFHGAWGNDSLSGTSGNDTLIGGAGNDTLNGLGGADQMRGGAGNDTYYVDNAGDSIADEAAGTAGGVDTVIAHIDWSAATRTTIEYLTAATGTSGIDLTGNALANKLTGNAGANILNGGTGADTMAGGLGNDTYYIDNAKDDISGESSASSGGVDTVITTIDWSAASDYVENVKAATGTASIDLTGNKAANVLTGNDGKNILNGGAGADTMAGGKGNDTYYVDNTKDDISGESSASSGGIDKVFSSVTFSIASDQVEYLELTGSAAINGTGNSLANILTGNSGKNVLNGGSGKDTIEGGAGADTLTGGSSADRFVYDSVSHSTKAVLDKITDFTRGSDKLDLSGLDGNAGKSGHQDFTFIGSKAFSANATGQLRFAVESGKVMLYGSTDADATAEFAVQISGTTTLSSSDFVF